MPNKTLKAFRLSDDVCQLLAQKSAALGITQADLVENAVRTQWGVRQPPGVHNGPKLTKAERVLITALEKVGKGQAVSAEGVARVAGMRARDTERMLRQLQLRRLVTCEGLTDEPNTPQQKVWSPVTRERAYTLNGKVYRGLTHDDLYDGEVLRDPAEVCARVHAREKGEVDVLENDLLVG